MPTPNRALCRSSSAAAPWVRPGTAGTATVSTPPSVRCLASPSRVAPRLVRGAGERLGDHHHLGRVGRGQRVDHPDPVGDPAALLRDVIAEIVGAGLVGRYDGERVAGQQGVEGRGQHCGAGPDADQQAGLRAVVPRQFRGHGPGGVLAEADGAGTASGTYSGGLGHLGRAPREVKVKLAGTAAVVRRPRAGRSVEGTPPRVSICAVPTGSQRAGSGPLVTAGGGRSGGRFDRRRPGSPAHSRAPGSAGAGSDGSLTGSVQPPPAGPA